MIPRSPGLTGRLACRPRRPPQALFLKWQPLVVSLGEKGAACLLLQEKTSHSQ